MPCISKRSGISAVFVILHLEEGIGTIDAETKAVISQEVELLLEIRTLLEQEGLQEMRFVKEERLIAKQLDQASKNHEWVLVKILEGKALQQNVVRLQMEELRRLHAQIISLLRVMKQGSPMSSPSPHHRSWRKDDYQDKLQYYLHQINKFARAYERILMHLVTKEQHLLGKGEK